MMAHRIRPTEKKEKATRQLTALPKSFSWLLKHGSSPSVQWAAASCRRNGGAPTVGGQAEPGVWDLGPMCHRGFM